jgi:hypothetical protein
VQGTDAKGLAKPIKPLVPWPKPSVLTQARDDAGGYSPMTEYFLADPGGKIKPQVKSE